jgi:4-aminobutyrate aminotransferase-like enzyme
MPDADLLARRQRVLGAGAPLFYDEPVHIVRGEGVHLFDADGRRYLDMYNNVPCVGHANPHVVEAMHRQASTLNVHSRYLNEGIVDYAERLIAKHDDSLERIVFTCTGTEANEVAMAMARFATGGRGFICSGHAYHGNSALVGKLTWAAHRSDPDIRAVRFPEAYRPIEEGRSEEELAELYLADVDAAIESFAAADVPFAGMLVCSIFANEGLPAIPESYMAGAAERVREAGGLFIADEVQAGFCRSGRWWGYETTGFVPDIATMGKPMGNGLPLAAAIARGDLVDTLQAKSGYFNTFAASPLQAAAGAAVLDVIESEKLLEQARDVGAHLREGLARVECDAIGDIRGHGLFVGVEWVSDRESKTADVQGAKRVVNRLKEKGFLTSNAGALFNVIKLRPPLVFRREHADEFLAAFEETVGELG